MLPFPYYQKKNTHYCDQKKSLFYHGSIELSLSCMKERRKLNTRESEEEGRGVEKYSV